jgi:hypothetical protein
MAVNEWNREWTKGDTKCEDTRRHDSFADEFCAQLFVLFADWHGKSMIAVYWLFATRGRVQCVDMNGMVELLSQAKRNTAATS